MESTDWREIHASGVLNCQRAIAQRIVKQGGDYALGKPGQTARGRLYLDDPAELAATAKPAVDADHGRIETRTATVSTDIAWLQKDHQWPGLAAIGKIVRIRESPQF